MINKTKVVVTVGPSTSSYEQLKKLILNGTDVIRINMSYANYIFCTDVINNVNALNDELNLEVAVLMDLMGPEIRTGKFVGGQAYLREGDKLEIVADTIVGNNTRFSINYPNLINEIDYDSEVLLDDGLIGIKLIDKKYDSLVFEVLNDGFIKDYTKLIIKGKSIKLPFLSQKDKDDILFAHKMDVTFLGLSHVKTAEDVLAVREILKDLDDDNIKIVTKVETVEALENIDTIAKFSDAINIARGDLGIALDFARVPGIQKKIINICHNKKIASLVSTELMSSMEHSIRPTRAEVSDVANAILDGCDAVVLSGEVAVGKFPIDTLIMLERIIAATEMDMEYKCYANLDDSNKNITDAIAISVVNVVNNLNCKAIIAPTNSGGTARKFSFYRPKCPIIAVSPNRRALKALQLNFAVNPVLIKELDNLDKIIEVSKEVTKKIVDIHKKDKIVITGGYPFKDVKITNFMEIEEL